MRCTFVNDAHCNYTYLDSAPTLDVVDSPLRVGISVSLGRSLKSRGDREPYPFPGPCRWFTPIGLWVFGNLVPSRGLRPRTLPPGTLQSPHPSFRSGSGIMEDVPCLLSRGVGLYVPTEEDNLDSTSLSRSVRGSPRVPFPLPRLSSDYPNPSVLSPGWEFLDLGREIGRPSVRVRRSPGVGKGVGKPLLDIRLPYTPLFLVSSPTRVLDPDSGGVWGRQRPSSSPREVPGSGLRRPTRPSLRRSRR